MPKSAIYKLLITCANETGFCLQSVVAKPRECTPLDLQAACENVKIEMLAEIPPQTAVDLTKFLLTGFFAQAHRSGLYNRQIKVWQALSRITEVRINRLQQGFLAKIDLPILDLFLCDARGQTLLMARLLEAAAVHADRGDSEKNYKNLLGGAIQRCEKSRSENPALVGFFLCWPKPLPLIVQTTVENITGAQDPIARYESLLPGAQGVCLDLIEFGDDQFSLVHPRLPDRFQAVG